MRGVVRFWTSRLAALRRLRSQTSVEASCSNIEANALGSDFRSLHGTSLKVCKSHEQLLDLTLLMWAREVRDFHNAYFPKDARFVPASNVSIFVQFPVLLDQLTFDSSELVLAFFDQVFDHAPPDTFPHNPAQLPQA